MTMLNQIHKAWDEEMYYVMELFLYGESYFILCISCIEDVFGHYMVVTWYFMMGGGHLTKQLEVISYVFKKDNFGTKHT